jgi:hypothetical protein
MCLKTLKADCAQVIQPGVQITTYWAYEKEIDTMPALKTTTGAGDTMEYDGNITLKEDAEWKEVTLHTKTGEVENEKVGENGIGGWVNRAMGQIAGNSSAAAEFAACATSACGVVLLFKQNDGQTRVIGAKGKPAVVKEWKENTGKTSTDFAGHTFSFEADNAKPAYFYGGTVTPIMA